MTSWGRLELSPNYVHTMSKTLLNMPVHVYESALSRRNSWIGDLYRWFREKANLGLGYTSLFSWWTVGYWVLWANLPFDSVQAQIPAMRDFIVMTFVLNAVAILVLHVLELLCNKPLAERGWPCISGSNARVLWGGAWWEQDKSVMMCMGLPATVFGVLLLMSSYMGWHGSSTALEHLWPGAGMVALGVLCFVLDRWEPGFGLGVPTDSEIRQRGRSVMAAASAVPPRSQAASTAAQEDYATPVEVRRPKLNFDGIFGMQVVKQKLLEASTACISDREQGSETPRNGILFHGEPGNGKTVFAEALAGELEVPFIQMTYGDVSSKWVGEMPRVIAKAFEYAKAKAPCVFFIDEIDSFITSRDSGSNNAEDLKITNTILTEIVALRGHRVVLIGATNYLSKLDAAAIREGRFDFKVEITPPDEPARIGLLSHGIKKHAGHLDVDQDALRSVAKRWSGFAVSRLLAVAQAVPAYTKERSLTKLGFDEWMGALREVQGRSGRLPVNTKSLGELILEAETRESIELVAGRLKDAHRIEMLGGSIPSGVLFHGPSGTGKTAAARALAKEAGWAFLSVAGPDLLSDRTKLDKLYAEAKDIRPTLIFIDEADDLLRNRQYSNTPDLCNKLLVLMDGTDERVQDVVFIAATNHPDQIDPALLRAGRFTEKVEFTLPPQTEIPRFISSWLKGKRVVLEPSVDAFDVSEMLRDQTIATIEGVLQYAVNRAISNHDHSTQLTLTLDDIKTARRVVNPEEF